MASVNCTDGTYSTVHELITHCQAATDITSAQSCRPNLGIIAQTAPPYACEIFEDTDFVEPKDLKNIDENIYAHGPPMLELCSLIGQAYGDPNHEKGNFWYAYTLSIPGWRCAHDCAGCKERPDCSNVQKFVPAPYSAEDLSFVDEPFCTSLTVPNPANNDELVHCVGDSAGTCDNPPLWGVPCQDTFDKADFFGQTLECANGIGSGSNVCRVNPKFFENEDSTKYKYGCVETDNAAMKPEAMAVSGDEAAAMCAAMGALYGSDEDNTHTNGWTVNATGVSCILAPNCKEIKWPDTTETKSFPFGKDFCESVGHQGFDPVTGKAHKPVTCGYTDGAETCSKGLPMLIAGIMAAVTMLL